MSDIQTATRKVYDAGTADEWTAPDRCRYPRYLTHDGKLVHVGFIYVDEPRPGVDTITIRVQGAKVYAFEITYGAAIAPRTTVARAWELDDNDRPVGLELVAGIAVGKGAARDDAARWCLHNVAMRHGALVVVR